MTSGSRIPAWLWPTMSNRLRQSLPTRPWPLGLGYTSGWAEPMYKYHASARLRVVCFCVVLSPIICYLMRFPLSARYNGPAEECDRITQKTQLRFTWQLTAEDFTEVCEVQLLCHHAARRGVHLPMAWKSRWYLGAAVPPVDALAHEAVRRARAELM